MEAPLLTWLDHQEHWQHPDRKERAMRRPKLWNCLAHALELPEDMSQAWWAAIARARWSQARGFRHTLVFFDQAPVKYQSVPHVQAWFDANATPQKLITLIERLVREGQLDLSTAQALGEHVLRNTNKDGQWRQKEKDLQEAL